VEGPSRSENFIFSVGDFKNNKTSQTQLGGHTEIIDSVKFSPDGEKIVSGGRDNKVIVWNVQDCSIASEFLF
jgi:WD40 repeat protein